MKRLFLILLAFAIIACNKNGENNAKKIDSTKIIDSMNVVIKKHNDSIRALNSKNNFDDLSGSHQLTFTNDEGKGKFFRLQQKVNSEGFVDYIDIHY